MVSGINRNFVRNEKGFFQFLDNLFYLFYHIGRYLRVLKFEIENKYIMYYTICRSMLLAGSN